MIDDTEFVNQTINQIKTNIQKVNQYTKQIESIEQKIGTAKDSQELRDSLKKIQDNCKFVLQICQKDVKLLHDYPSTKSGEYKIKKDRLSDELMKTMNAFQKALKAAFEKQIKHNIPAKAFYSNENNSHSFEPALMEANRNNNNAIEQRVQLQQSKSVELQMVQERKANMDKLEKDMVDLNHIFKDLAVIVQDQGEVIDNIEMNVEAVSEFVSDANVKIIEAKRSNEKARKKKCCIWLIIILAIVVLLLILFLALRPYL